MDTSQSKKLDNAKPSEVDESIIVLPANPSVHVDEGLYQTTESLSGVEATITPSMTFTHREAGILPTAASCKPRSDVRVSRYTTGYLTTSGWLPIDKHSWPAEPHGAYTDIESMMLCEGSTLNIPVLVEDDEESTEMLIRQNEEEISKPFIDDKYFEYHGYLDYLSNISKIDEHPESNDSAAIARYDTTIVSSDSDRESDRVSSITSGMDTLTVRTPTTEQNTTSNPLPISPTSAASTIPNDHIDEEDAGIRMALDNNTTATSSLGMNPADIAASKPVQRKAQNIFAPEEDEWLLLFHKKIKATVEAGFMIKMPGPIFVLNAFNKFFEGKVLQNDAGRTLPPRLPRDIISMRGKFARKDNNVWKLRNVTRKLLEGTHGGPLYVPVIMEEDLQEYCAFGSFETDDPTDVTKNASLRSNLEVSGKSPSKRKLEETDMDTSTRESKRVGMI